MFFVFSKYNSHRSFAASGDNRKLFRKWSNIGWKSKQKYRILDARCAELDGIRNACACCAGTNWCINKWDAIECTQWRLRQICGQRINIENEKLNGYSQCNQNLFDFLFNFGPDWIPNIVECTRAETFIAQVLEVTQNSNSCHPCSWDVHVLHVLIYCWRSVICMQIYYSLPHTLRNALILLLLLS